MAAGGARAVAAARPRRGQVGLAGALPVVRAQDRGRGVGTALFAARSRWPGRHGAIAVEGWPLSTGEAGRGDDFVGRENVFELAGFRCVSRPTRRGSRSCGSTWVAGGHDASVIATKLYVPRREPGLVGRPRLLERLRRTGSRLTLVSAPAGFGKTTLLAAWLGRRDRRTGGGVAVARRGGRRPGVVLDVRGDRAADGAVPGVGAGALELLGVGPAADRAGAHHGAQRARRGARRGVAGARRLPPGRQPRDPRRHGLPAGAPPAARAPGDQHAAPTPTCRWPGWRVRGELVEIRAADLRFTSDEAAAYLNDVDRAGPRPPSDVAALEERTEGWIAALQLAALSLQGRDGRRRLHRPVRRGRPVHRRLPRRGGAARTSPSRCAGSCCSSAVLDRLTGPLCDAVTGRDDGSRDAHRPWSAPTCSSCPWTTGGSGTATTTCSPTCCGRACSASSRTWFRCCTSAPASGTSATT